MANSEFWRELKPIEQKFRPGALPEAYVANAPTDDDRFYAPLSETVGTRPLWISPSQNRWCDVLMCRGAGLVNRHYPAAGLRLHDLRQVGLPGHDSVATAGDAVYEAPASRTRWSPRVRRADAGDVQRHRAADLAGRERRAERHLDVFDYIALCREHYANGISTDYINQLFRVSGAGTRPVGRRKGP